MTPGVNSAQLLRQITYYALGMFVGGVLFGASVVGLMWLSVSP